MKGFSLHGLYFLLVCVSTNTLAARDALENIPEDGKFNFTQLAAKYGHEADEYEVTTADGFLLSLFRMRNDGNKHILLWHGLFDSSDTFLLRGKTSLGITLAEAGYTVWYGNNRGNVYSRRHTKLNPNWSQKYWDFSFHEFGVYDLPATIDYILNATQLSKIPVIGHSQGNLIHYVMGSEKPEYNNKISVLIALNPVCYLKNIKDEARNLIAGWPLASFTSGLLGGVELFRANTAARNDTKAYCTQKTNKTSGYELCAKKIAFPIFGEDPDEIEEEFFPVIVGHYPSGTSKKDADHVTQLITHDTFSQFDYGFVGNIAQYGVKTQLPYNLKNVVMPIVMLAAKNDNIATLEDVERLRDELPNVKHYQVMDREKLNHVDMVWGKNVKDYFYPTLFEMLDKYAKPEMN